MSLAKLLDDLPIPIIQAPMLGAHDERLALAACRAGALGSFPVSSHAPEDIEPAIEALRAQAGDAPFAVNLFVLPERASASAETLDAALARLRPWYDKVGAPLPEHPNSFAPDFEGQLAALTRAAPPIASFTFGALSRAQVEALHDGGTYVLGTANTVAEARAWAQVGADGIVAQGMDAGGHRGNFLADIEESLVGALPLTAAIIAAVELPVIAAGGIMDGRGLAAVLALGAKAAQMGTAFLLSEEATSHPLWRAAIEAAPDDPTRLTRAFSGRYARGIENRFMRDMRSMERDVPAYPVQNRLTQPLRAAAAKAGDAEAMALWAGQGVKLARPGGAEEMVRRWWREAREAARLLADRTGVA
ncbi:NAD(P)H-dependent flavin oxidoreductase [Phenylobacterium soli]|uniref:Nitronate monooxygenase n=1 Tax=Phenylobacterium soli TaxID=2170551 RepID=A0A328AIH4_9CAUL|nr:nitronate monooxygenase [Phenylobacterium soli]RAK54723.1 nitronate monooxygenase [Phenylobacterium soli]